MPDQVVCLNCGAENPAENRFCGSCGSSLAVTCPSCGHENPPGNSFCGSCGTNLREASPEITPAETEERKVVTSLFADLVASTELAARLDPEELRQVLKPFFEAMREEVQRYGGTVQKFIGDAVVAFFGVPVAHEDDPERAVRAALAMQRRLDELNQELSDRAGGDLTMRIGLNTGEVFAHGGGADEGIVTGEAVSVAARFQSLAEPGRVVVGDRTWRDTRHLFSFRSLGEVGVKGVDRPLVVWELEGEHERPWTASHALTAPFVGREGELELLEVLFARTLRERRPNLVTIVGPPGIGKSRLARQITGRPDGARVVRGRCLPYGDGLTYWPLAEILKSDAGILDSDSADLIREKARATLAPRLEGKDSSGVTSVLLSSIGVTISSDPLAGAEPSAAQQMIVKAWQRYLETLVAERPLLALIEDIHWADLNLLDLIETVIGRASGPAFVLCTARPDLYERKASWSGGLTNATTLSLSPLSAAEGTALIEHLLGGEAPPEVVGPVLHRSEGNPFFAEELLRMMTEDGTLERVQGRWELVRALPSSLPDTVQGVIASRIDLLSPAEKRAVQDASVVGRTFWQGGLERLGTPEVGRAVDGLIDKGLVVEHDTSSIYGERELHFHHVLTKDVAYSSIPRARRAEAHLLVGEWVEEGTSGREEEFAEILAHHFREAGDTKRTARYATIAGDRHRRVFAADEAIRWYDRALEAAGDEVELVGGISLARGMAREQLGLMHDAHADYELALGCGRDANDDQLEAQALAALAHVLWNLDRYEEGQAILPGALERARQVGARDLEARLLYTAGTTQFGRGEFTQALEHHREALRVAGEIDDREAEALAHHGMCETLCFLGPWEQALDHGMQADALLRDLGQRPMVAHNAYMVAWGLGFRGRVQEGIEVAAGSIEESKELGNRRDEGFAYYDRASLLLCAGRVSEALRDAQTGRSIFQELGLPRGEMIGHVLCVEAYAEIGTLEQIGPDGARAVEISDALDSRFMRGMAVAAKAWAELAHGDDKAASAAFARARKEASSRLDALWTSRMQAITVLQGVEAEPLDDLAAFIEAQAQEGDIWGCWAMCARAQAALLQTKHELAAELGTAAAQASEAVNEHRASWRAHLTAGLSMAELGRAREAEENLKRGKELVGMEAEGLPAELREIFLARRDVSALMS